MTGTALPPKHAWRNRLPSSGPCPITGTWTCAAVFPEPPYARRCPTGSPLTVRNRWPLVPAPLRPAGPL